MKILFITNGKEQEDRPNDFMHDMVLLGLREIFGEEVIDFPAAWYMYPDEVKKKILILKICGAKVLHFMICCQTTNR